MNAKHLNDAQIQEYLDEKGNGRRSRFQEHVDACPDCRGLLQRYQFLYSVLQRDQTPDLERDFAHSVLERIPAALAQPRDSSFVPALLIGLGLAAILAVFVVLADLPALVTVAGKMIRPLWGFWAMMRQGAGKWLPGRFSLIFFSGLALLSVAVADRLLRRHFLNGHSR